MPLLLFSLLAFSLKAYAQEIPEVSAEDVEKQQDSIGESIENGVNQFLYKHGITPTTISYHPNGEVLISTQYFKELKEQYMLLEHISGQVESIQKELQENRHTAVNLNRAMKDIEKMQVVIEEMKDKIRSNGGH